jgi:hypothetical protein
MHKPHIAKREGKWKVYWIALCPFRDAIKRFDTLGYYSQSTAWSAYVLSVSHGRRFGMERKYPVYQDMM